MTQERVWKLKYVNYSQVSFPESGTENEKINPEDSNKRRVFLEKFGDRSSVFFFPLKFMLTLNLNYLYEDRELVISLSVLLMLFSSFQKI